MKYWDKLEAVKLVFFEHKNSFTLQILNLKELSIEQIKLLEEFSRVRRGVFDFEKERISIQKRLKQKDVEKLFQLLKIDVEFLESHSVIKKSVDDKQTSKSSASSKPTTKVTFGKYKGKLYSDLPDNYLQWLVENYNGFENENISNEVIRRTIG